MRQDRHRFIGDGYDVAFQDVPGPGKNRGWLGRQRLRRFLMTERPAPSLPFVEVAQSFPDGLFGQVLHRNVQGGGNL